MPKAKRKSMKFYSLDVIRRDITATRRIHPKSVRLSRLGRNIGVAVPLSWIVTQALELAAHGKTHMRFIVMIPHEKINYGVVMSPSDYGLFIQSTSVRQEVGYTEDIPPIKAP